MEHDHDQNGVAADPLLPPRAVEEQLGLPRGFLSRRLQSPDPPPHFRFSRKTILLRPSRTARWIADHAA
jgi:hypothetical protein